VSSCRATTPTHWPAPSTTHRGGDRRAGAGRQAGAYDLAAGIPAGCARRPATATAHWLIADEVQSGMGRSGAPFAIDVAGVLPDMLTAGQVAGGGFPVGALLTAPAWRRARSGDLGTTFGGGPLACAMVEATVIDTIEPQTAGRTVRSAVGTDSRALP
jgi:acetylornithine/N-succinyldiaminopimelate aminotransferase